MAFETDHALLLTAPDAPVADRPGEAGFTENAPVADRPVEAGVTEGTSRTHPGQGTTNRRFVFQNAMFELLWVHDETEAGGEPTVQTPDAPLTIRC